jgi:hypothetical protein
MILKLSILLFLLSYDIIISQVTEEKGNLLRINFNDSAIDLGDTLWQWFSKTDGYYSYSVKCEKVFKIDSTEYLYTRNYSHHEILLGVWSTSKYLYNLCTKEEKLVRAFGHSIDVIIEPYMSYSDRLYQDSDGMWILNGVSGNVFINQDDSLFYYYPDSMKIKLTYIIGKVDNQNFVAVRNDSIGQKYDYYLSDLSKLPDIELKEQVVIDYSDFDEEVPLKIVQLKDSLYLLNTESSSSLYLAVYSHNRLKIEKVLEYNFYSDWYSEDYKIYYMDNYSTHGFIREEFNFSSTAFEKSEVLYENISNHYVYDNQYLVLLYNDSLKIYDYKNLSLINKYDLSGIKYADGIILCAPNIYLHQINEITDINDEFHVPRNINLFQNYPNPFNPTTTINYELPKASNVELKIYDILGREIKTLVDEYQQPGIHNSVFNTQNSSLSSGVYFYKLKADTYLEVKKMLLLK